MITYQVEDYNDCKDECEVLHPAHYDEIATDKEVIPLDKNEIEYQMLADHGQLHVVTARKDGTLIGYHYTIVRPHLHYKSTLMGFTDMYFIIPAERKGWIGVKMFKEVERSLARRGVVKLFTATKVYLDLSSMFLYMGYRKQEVVFSKILKE